MGIDSLLKALKSVTKPRHISEYSNKKIAVDTYCWLHKGIFLCAQELQDGRETNEHINYCLKKVELLKKYNITVIMVSFNKKQIQFLEFDKILTFNKIKYQSYKSILIRIYLTIENYAYKFNFKLILYKIIQINRNNQCLRKNYVSYNYKFQTFKTQKGINTYSLQ